MNAARNTQTLVEAFGAVADQVQALTDHKTILEHKLRFAHEQFQYLAYKYAPTAPEISETIAKLQLPSTYHDHPSVKDVSVPLPRRKDTLDSSHQIALLIRDGRRAASQLAASSSSASAAPLCAISHSPRTHTHTVSHSPPSSKQTPDYSHSPVTSMSTVLEQDFTVEGRKGQLECPFSAVSSVRQQAGSSGERPGHGRDVKRSVQGPDLISPDQDQDVIKTEGEGEEQTKEQGKPENLDGAGSLQCPAPDPICAAMSVSAQEESASQTDPSNKCPIRYLDKHSPQQIAEYVEKHKHQIPRSHEICVRRYQHNDEQVRKLDAKYGNLVSMIEGLSHVHKPMLSSEEAAQQELWARRQAQGYVENDDDGDDFDYDGRGPAETPRRSKAERVKSWAQQVSQSAGTDAEGNDADDEAGNTMNSHDDNDNDNEDGDERHSHFDRPMKEVRVGESPSRPWGIPVPPPEIRRPGGDDAASTQSSAPVPVRMPTALTGGSSTPVPVSHKTDTGPAPRKCPFDHTKMAAMGLSREAMARDMSMSVPAAAASPNLPFTPMTAAFSRTGRDDGEDKMWSGLRPGVVPPACPRSQEKFAAAPAPGLADKKADESKTADAPVFIQVPGPGAAGSGEDKDKTSSSGAVAATFPQMVFNGPVFIGYPIEDALRLMQQFQQGRSA